MQGCGIAGSIGAENMPKFCRYGWSKPQGLPTELEDPQTRKPTARALTGYVAEGFEIDKSNGISIEKG
jgi:hypothetical protein